MTSLLRSAYSDRPGVPEEGHRAERRRRAEPGEVETPEPQRLRQRPRQNPQDHQETGRGQQDREADQHRQIGRRKTAVRVAGQSRCHGRNVD